MVVVLVGEVVAKRAIRGLGVQIVFIQAHIAGHLGLASTSHHPEVGSHQSTDPRIFTKFC